MNEAVEQNKDEISCGERLANKRSEKELSINQVAREIKIEPRVIEMIENNDFESIGAPVFVKGYLRQYSELVGLDPDLIIEKYSAINSIEDSPPIVNDSVDQISKYVLTPKIILIAIFVILISFGVLATVFGIFGNNETVVIKMETEAESQESLLPSVTAPQIDLSETQIDETFEMETETESQESLLTSTSNEFFTEENLMNLTIIYSGLCWTEIFDANGERLFFGLGDQDREVNIDGVPPFDVMLGAADNLLEIELEGREYTIVDSIRRGEVLRFKVVDDQI
jgi:cytoskeleton protein RodZ